MSIAVIKTRTAEFRRKTARPTQVRRYRGQARCRHSNHTRTTTRAAEIKSAWASRKFEPFKTRCAVTSSKPASLQICFSFGNRNTAEKPQAERDGIKKAAALR